MKIIKKLFRKAAVPFVEPKEEGPAEIELSVQMAEAFPKAKKIANEWRFSNGLELVLDTDQTLMTQSQIDRVIKFMKTAKPIHPFRVSLIMDVK